MRGSGHSDRKDAAAVAEIHRVGSDELDLESAGRFAFAQFHNSGAVEAKRHDTFGRIRRVRERFDFDPWFTRNRNGRGRRLCWWSLWPRLGPLRRTIVGGR